VTDRDGAEKPVYELDDEQLEKLEKLDDEQLDELDIRHSFYQLFQDI
jgi:hypothetical protein